MGNLGIITVDTQFYQSYTSAYKGPSESPLDTGFKCLLIKTNLSLLQQNYRGALVEGSPSA